MPGFREMRPGDVKQCHKLLAKYLERFDLAPTFTEAEFEHWFLPRENVVYTYVVANPSQGGKITDFVSFYALPSSVINNDKHKDIKAAYLFYYAHTATPLKALLDDMIVMAGKVRPRLLPRMSIMGTRGSTRRRADRAAGDRHRSTTLTCSTA